MLLFESNERTELDNYNALRCDENMWMKRYNLENKIFKHYGFKLSLLNDHNYINNDYFHDNVNFIIQDNIKKRYVLYNVKKMV